MMDDASEGAVVISSKLAFSADLTRVKRVPVEQDPKVHMKYLPSCQSSSAPVLLHNQSQGHAAVVVAEQ